MSGGRLLLVNVRGKGIWERRMREIRTSGVTRGEQVTGHGMRVLSHVRGNPDTDVYRSLNAGYPLSYSTVIRG
jgi:hypothetical protein